MKMRIFIGLLICAWVLASEAMASYEPIDHCYKISHSPSSSKNKPGRAESVQPEYGTTDIWVGALNTNYANMAMPDVNIASLQFQPVGTVLGTAVKHFLDFAEKGDFSPNQVLFKCPAAAAGRIFEMYSTNGDYKYGGRDDREVGAAFGMEHVYATYKKGLGFRLTNLATGEYFSPFWKARPLTGLDRDGNGNILVKAKDFSNVKIELIRVPDESGVSAIESFNDAQPLGYLATRMPLDNLNSLAGPEPGRNHRTHFPGWYGDWPATIGLYKSVTMHRGKTCLVNFVTPTVTFPIISVMELSQGSVRRGQFSVSYQCEQGAERGVGPGEISMFFLTSPEAFATAQDLSLVEAGVATPYLLSENYHAETTAKGVAVTLYDESGTQLRFADPNRYFDRGANPAQMVPGGTQLGENRYIMSFEASLGQVGNGIAITPGQYSSTARVVMRFN
ncbi:fimbrial protein [Salinivibrio costicola]|uniref:fimbrial protein n=1 Tax=Salinivibrio costicola TaxID=51367 RepID=UPI003F6E7D8B